MTATLHNEGNEGTNEETKTRRIRWERNNDNVNGRGSSILYGVGWALSKDTQGWAFGRFWGILSTSSLYVLFIPTPSPSWL